MRTFENAHDLFMTTSSYDYKANEVIKKLGKDGILIKITKKLKF